MSETIFSVTASLVLREGVYEFTPRYSCNKHPVPLIMAGKEVLSLRPAQLLNSQGKLFCMIRQQSAGAAHLPVVACVCVLHAFLWAN